MGSTTTDRLLMIIDAKTKKAEAGFKSIDRVLEDIDFGIEKANSHTQKMGKLMSGLMGAGLSMLFTGMALKRMFQTGLNGILSTYMLVNGENDVVVNGINNIKAKWLFFKESLAESGALSDWVDRLSKMLDWLNGMSEPMQEFITNVIIWGIVLSTVLMVAGQIMLAILGIVALVEFGLIVPLLSVVAIFILIVAWVVVWNSKISNTKKLILLVIIAMAILVALALLGVSPWLLIVVAIGLVIAILWKFRKQTKLAFMELGQVINDTLIGALKVALYMLEKMIYKIQELSFGKLFKGFTGFDTSNLQGINWTDKINTLKAEIESDKNKPGIKEQFKEKSLALTQIFNVDSVIGERDLKELSKEGINEALLNNGGSTTL